MLTDEYIFKDDDIKQIEYDKEEEKKRRGGKKRSDYFKIKYKQRAGEDPGRSQVSEVASGRKKFLEVKDFTWLGGSNVWMHMYSCMQNVPKMSPKSAQNITQN